MCYLYHCYSGRSGRPPAHECHDVDDARSRKEMQEINDTGHPVLDYCGKETSFEWMIPKALWIKRHRKDIYDVCYRIVDQLDWMNYQLCGEWSSSICNTTCKWNYVSSMGGYQYVRLSIDRCTATYRLSIDRCTATYV